MIELSREELDGLLRFNKRSIALYFYTPLCGTCKFSTQMLDIVTETLPNVTVYKCNINLLADIANKWQIESVPCLLILNKNRVVNKVYALKSVAYLYTILQPLQDE